MHTPKIVYEKRQVVVANEVILLLRFLETRPRSVLTLSDIRIGLHAAGIEAKRALEVIELLKTALNSFGIGDWLRFDIGRGYKWRPEGTLRLYEKRERQCPFYGFRYSRNPALAPPTMEKPWEDFYEIYGECPLGPGGGFLPGPPCIMELQQKKPIWRDCFFHHPEKIGEFLRTTIIYPEDEGGDLPRIEMEVEETVADTPGRRGRPGTHIDRKKVPDPRSGVHLIDWYLRYS